MIPEFHLENLGASLSIKVQEVFVPGAYPQHTYIQRAARGLEQELRDALETPGQVISLAGPSKSGKTVLVEKVVGRNSLIPISGAILRTPDEVWDRVLDWMDVPTSTTSSRTTSGKIGGEVSTKGGLQLPLIAKGEVGVAANAELSREASNEIARERRGLAQVVHEVGGSDFVILLDDFHYMERSVQVEVAKTLKEATRLGVKIITAAVSHRGDDIVRANPELRGRVRAIDLGYWIPDELRQIAAIGFSILNLNIDPQTITTFIEESAGSPQLMQLLCLHACLVLNLREQASTKFTPSVDRDVLVRILEQTSSNTDFRSLIDVLDAGPRTRGTERKTYKFHDGTEGDVYRVVLRALADAPPQLSFPYQDLLGRTVKVCVGESPVGSSVTSTCLTMAKLAREKLPNERAVDWDEQKQVFDIPDPYLLFYLRWSNRLKEG
jgi:hypothetical protein